MKSRISFPETIHLRRADKLFNVFNKTEKDLERLDMLPVT